MTQSKGSNKSPDRRFYISNLGSVDEQAVLVEQHLRGDSSISATLKELVIKGLDATSERRIRLVRFHAHLEECSFEQAWLRLATGRAMKIDLSHLSEEDFQRLYKRLKNTSLGLD